MKPPGVLMVTGAYHPEVSGAGLQCRALMQALRGQVRFTVLTTSANGALPRQDSVEGIRVNRVPVDVRRRLSRARATVAMCRAFWRSRRECDIVHLHGFSQKSLLVILLAKLFRKKVVLKLTSVGHDDPVTIRAASMWRYQWYRQANRFVGVSPRFHELYSLARLPENRFRLIPNGVDVRRFAPADTAERRAARHALGLSDQPWTLCVGFFSREKHPEILYEAWRQLRQRGCAVGGLLFVGATRGSYYEVDPSLAEVIRADARRRGLADQVVFVERTEEMALYYQAASLFVMPSSREGLPNALLEAMACGLPCVVSRIAGVTEAIVDDGVNGLLVPPEDIGALEAAMERVVATPGLAEQLGAQARSTIESRYAMSAVAGAYVRLYRELADAEITRRTANRFGFLWAQSAIPRTGNVPRAYHFERMAHRLNLGRLGGRILDAGCGEGVDLVNQARQPGVQVIGVELSEGGCRASRRRAAGCENAHVIQANLCRLPFEADQFDHVYSYGVIHHVAAPEQAVQELARVLKPGGRCLIYVYEDFSERPRILRWMLAAANSFRVVTTRLPEAWLYRLCQAASPIIFFLFTVPYRAMRRLPQWRGIAEQMPFRHAPGPFGLAGDLYDRFSAPVEYRYSRQEAQQLLQAAGLEEVVVAFERGWMVTGVKPAEVVACAG